MSAIAKTIWMIETHFGTALSLDEMAEHAGVSRSHLSRIFPLVTGWSISAYLRGRRLTEAAKALADGAPDILSVALDAGYGSHEAFTRAFRDQFGTTPDEVRRSRSLDALQMVEPLPMEPTTLAPLAAPRIETIRRLRIAGLQEHQIMDNTNGFPAQWQKFQSYIGHIDGAVPGAAYGVVVSADENSCEYLTGQEVMASADMPREFDVVSIPGRTYACFRHAGHISTIRSTIHDIFAGWLPTSGRTMAEGTNFIEYYGPDFNPQTGLGTCEIWIGLKD